MKIAQELMLPVMCAAIFIAFVLAESPAFARGNHGGHRGHHAGGHVRGHFSTYPSTSFAGYYCSSLNRRVRDARECPDQNTPPPDAPATHALPNRENG